ncbi:MAG: ABC transporter permease [Neisseriaceae bacterium]|nr:ABC transporter permease [Neisseriaceae bacterium]MBP6861786.1 ABC transporter permease [Neisseriaceae bacterium]
MQPTRFWQAFKQTFRHIFTDQGVLLMVVLAPIIYGFFYPWPYGSQQALKVPAAVVDYDNSNLSRQIIRFASASPKIDVLRLNSEQEAKEALWRGQIEGYMVIPPNLKHDVLHRKAANVAIAGNGSYALLNKSVLYGFSEAVGTVSAGIAIKQFTAQGQSPDQAMMSAQPLSLKTKAYYNPSEGYGSYVVPAVALLILQQTLLIGSALFAGTLYEAKTAQGRAPVWLGRIGAISLVSALVMAFYFGWLFTWQDFGRGGNVLGALLLILLYAPTVTIWGLLCGLWFKVRERSVQVILFTSMPMYFMTGFSWPSEGLPPLARLLGWLIPSTPAIHASVRLNQMGASMAEVAPYLVNILALGLIGLALLCWFGRTRPQAKTATPTRRSP